MAADTQRTLTARLPIENHYTPGLFGVTSKFSGGVILVTYTGTSGSEIAYLRNPGDSVTLDLIDVDQIVVEAKLADLVTDAYPAAVLILQTTSKSTVLTAAPYYSATGSGNTLFHADVEVSAVGSGTTAIYTPPVGSRAIVTSVFLTSDAAVRCGVVDGTDAGGNRLIVSRSIGSVGRFLGDPDGFVQSATHTALNLVYAGGGNYWAAVAGFLQVG